MINIDLKRSAKKFIERLPPRHQKQIKNHILSLRDNPMPHDVKKLIGYENYLRTDIGEYRIIYRYESKSNMIIVVLVGKRNDDAVYRIATRSLK